MCVVFVDLVDNIYFVFKNFVYVKYDLSEIDINSSYVYMCVVEGIDIDVLVKILIEWFFSGLMLE